MMTPTRVTLAGLVLLHVCVGVWAAPAPEVHPVSERDTDLDSEIRTKLQKIRELLAQMEPQDEESELKKVAAVKEESQAEEKDMRSLSQSEDEDDKMAVPPMPHSRQQIRVPTKLKKHEDSSVEILAQALARLQQPRASGGDSDGELMGSKYNEESSESVDTDSQITKDLEDSIRKALTRLQEEGESEGSEESEMREKPPKSGTFHDEAIQIVESRLIRDMTLANRLGLSVEDLIQDLEEQALREETLRRLDNSLATLTMGRDE